MSVQTIAVPQWFAVLLRVVGLMTAMLAGAALIGNPSSPDPITPIALLIPLAAGLLLLAVGYDVIGKLTHPANATPTQLTGKERGSDRVARSASE